MSDESPILPYAAVILKLLQDILYFDDKQWNLLLSYETAVKAHFAMIGLQLIIDEMEGYAYLIQPDQDENSDGPALPRLIRRSSLSYRATLLAVLLRERLLEFDAQEPDNPRLILSKEQIRELMRLFYGEKGDETRLFRQIDQIIGQVERAGFLKRLKTADEDLYEVRRIIKAKISADTLVEIKEKLKEYAETDVES